MTTFQTGFPFLPLFVPGDRTERFGKAARSGADIVIVDLEDAVAPGAKASARDGLHTGMAAVATRLAFRSLDFAVSIGARHARPALEGARREIVLASALHGRPGPIDGVTPTVDNEAAVQEDSEYAAMLGFGGKLLIHPRQIGAATRGFSPTDEEIARAEAVLAADAAGTAGGATALLGAMIDAPVVKRALSIRRRAARRAGL